MFVLGIESSCDETAAAVVEEGRIIRSNVIASQVDIHRRYGGVVPEIASRKHMEAVIPVIMEALAAARITLDEVAGIAATQGPGLIGSLLVGLSVGKALAYARGLPFIGVNHLEGHIAAVFLDQEAPEFPFIALVVSGGHTNLYLVRALHSYQLLGQTRDDAAGEALDKAAKLLNIGYPGGVVIDRLARTGDRRRIRFPRAMRDSLDFSFSGLKTALAVMIKKRECPFPPDELPDVAASYQEAIVDVLVEKTVRAAEMHRVSRIVICGGVAANSRLRERMCEIGSARELTAYTPSPVLCTDNAAMIAVVGHHFLCNGRHDPLDLNAISRWPLDSVKK